MPTDYEMKDSGVRRESTTGAVRDRAKGKGRFDLISPEFLQRLANVMEKGALKYDDRNWEKGMPLSWYMDSAQRHLNQYLAGKRDEDHLGQAGFNVMALVHTDAMIRDGRLPAELNDLPEPWSPPVIPFLPARPTPHCVYVAGPYGNAGKILDDAVRETNCNTAINFGRMIAKRGHFIHVPHAATHPFDGEWDYEQFMALDFSIIRKWATALYRVPGESAGADREVALARELGLPVWYRPCEVPYFISLEGKSIVMDSTRSTVIDGVCMEPEAEVTTHIPGPPCD